MTCTSLFNLELLEISKDDKNKTTTATQRCLVNEKSERESAVCFPHQWAFFFSFSQHTFIIPHHYPKCFPSNVLLQTTSENCLPLGISIQVSERQNILLLKCVLKKSSMGCLWFTISKHEHHRFKPTSSFCTNNETCTWRVLCFSFFPSEYLSICTPELFAIRI